MSPQLRRVYAELTDWMEALPPHDGRRFTDGAFNRLLHRLNNNEAWRTLYGRGYGLIHGDYRPGNVIWDGTTARTIDFDEPNYHWYIADVSRALMELFDQPLAQRRKFGARPSCIRLHVTC